MSKGIGRVISILSLFLFVVSLTLPISASAASIMIDSTLELEELSNKYLSVSTTQLEDGREMKTITNIDRLKQSISSTTNLSDLEVAQQLYSSVGEDPNVIANLSEEKLLEVLDFSSCIQTTSYLKCPENGEQVSLSREELVNELVYENDLTSDGADFIAENIALVHENLVAPAASIDTTSNDGYLKLTTTAYETTGSEAGRTYYIVSAYAVWLKEPVFKVQDVLAITSTATYDNNYNNYGYFYEYCEERILGYDEVIATYTLDSYIYKNSGPNNPNDIWFEYSAGVGGIVLRFDMFERTYSGSQAHDFDYTMQAYVRFKCSLYSSDGGVQAAYGHRQLSINGISVDLSSGAIGLSIVGSMAKYYGETLSIYY